VEKRLAMVGSFNGFGRFGIEGWSEEDGERHRFEKRRQAERLTRPPWVWRSQPEASRWRLHWPKVATAIASGGVWRCLEEEEARVAGWAAWAGPRWLGGLGQPAGQGQGSGGDKAAEEERNRDGPG
jgi:hypothetical protein